jgi:ankyrin repeat protein
MIQDVFPTAKPSASRTPAWRKAWNRRWTPFFRAGTILPRLVVAFALGSAIPAHAAPQADSDWWVGITNDRVNAVKTQVARGVDVNAVNERGQPAVMQAIRDQAWAVYDYLAARRDLEVNAVNTNQETPLMYLAVVGETKRAEALIRRGAQVNRLGWTPLHYAASTGKVETARMLIRHKAIINAPGPDGTTPLMMAAYAGSEATVQLLLGAGADPTAINAQKQTAADWARLKQHTRLAARLDDLIERVRKQRVAQAQSAGQGEEGRIGTVDLTKPSAPEAGPETGSRGAASGAQRDVPAGGGYFNLDRDYDNAAP